MAKITPGAGWGGATTPTTVGAGGATAIADVIWPGNRLVSGSSIYVGIMAAHHLGIDYVRASVEDGTWVQESSWSDPGSTGTRAYWFELDPSDFSTDGTVEVRFEAVPNTNGVGKVISQTFTVNPNGTIGNATDDVDYRVYVDASSGDDANDGTSGSPVETLWKASNILHTRHGTSCDFGEIRCAAGTYLWYRLNGQLTAQPTAGWITIRPDDGVAKANVIIKNYTTTANNNGPFNQTGYGHIKGCTLTADTGGNTSILKGPTVAGRRLWVEDCDYVRGTVGDDEIVAIVGTTDYEDEIWVTGGSYDGIPRGHVYATTDSTLRMLGVSADGVEYDFGAGASVIGDCTISNALPWHHGLGDYNHSDFWQQRDGITDDNILVFRNRATDGVFLQTFFNRPTNAQSNHAFFLNIIDNSGYDGDNTLYRGQLIAEYEHFVMHHNTLLGADTWLRLSDSYSSGFWGGTYVSIRNNVFQGVTIDDTEVERTGHTWTEFVSGNGTAVVDGNAFIGYYPTGKVNDSPMGEGTTGTTNSLEGTLADRDGDTWFESDFKVKSGSALASHLMTPVIPEFFDGTSPGGGTAPVGAMGEQDPAGTITPGGSWDGTTSWGGRTVPTESVSLHGSGWSFKAMACFADAPMRWYTTATQIVVVPEHGDGDWIDYVEFWLEGNTQRVSTQSVSTDGRWGFVIDIDPTSWGQDGDLQMYATVVPVNGYERLLRLDMIANGGGTISRDVRYLDPAGSDAANGLTTGTAWQTLGKALNGNGNGAPDGAEVRCANGTYIDDTELQPFINNNDRTITILPDYANGATNQGVTFSRTNRSWTSGGQDYQTFLRVEHVEFQDCIFNMDKLGFFYGRTNTSTMTFSGCLLDNPEGITGPTYGYWGSELGNELFRQADGAQISVINCEFQHVFSTGASLYVGCTGDVSSDAIYFARANNHTYPGGMGVINTNIDQTAVMLQRRHEEETLTVATATYDGGTGRTTITWSGSPNLDDIAAGGQPGQELSFLTGTLTGQDFEIYEQVDSTDTTVVVGDASGASASDTGWVWIIFHADSFQFAIQGSNDYDNVIMSGCKFVGGYQPWFFQAGNGRSLDNVGINRSIFDYTSGGSESAQWQHGHEHVVFRNVTMAGTTNNFRDNTAGFALSGCVIDSCVFGANGSDTGSLPSGVTLNHVHTESGPQWGTNATQGAITYDAEYKTNDSDVVKSSGTPILFDVNGDSFSGLEAIGAATAAAGAPVPYEGYEDLDYVEGPKASKKAVGLALGRAYSEPVQISVFGDSRATIHGAGPEWHHAINHTFFQHFGSPWGTPFAGQYTFILPGPFGMANLHYASGASGLEALDSDWERYLPPGFGSKNGALNTSNGNYLVTNATDPSLGTTAPSLGYFMWFWHHYYHGYSFTGMTGRYSELYPPDEDLSLHVVAGKKATSSGIVWRASPRATVNGNIFYTSVKAYGGEVFTSGELTGTVGEIVEKTVGTFRADSISLTGNQIYNQQVSVHAHTTGENAMLVGMRMVRPGGTGVVVDTFSEGGYKYEDFANHHDECGDAVNAIANAGMNACKLVILRCGFNDAITSNQDPADQEADIRALITQIRTTYGLDVPVVLIPPHDRLGTTTAQSGRVNEYHGVCKTIAYDTPNVIVLNVYKYIRERFGFTPESSDITTAGYNDQGPWDGTSPSYVADDLVTLGVESLVMVDTGGSPQNPVSSDGRTSWVNTEKLAKEADPSHPRGQSAWRVGEAEARLLLTTLSDAGYTYDGSRSRGGGGYYG